MLFLQEFRNSIQDAWTPFMEWISHFAVAYLLLFPVFIYWCIDKKKGLYTITSATFCIALNSVVKLTACVYRPWIRDERIIPAGDAMREATGYSFPSGHTTTATTLYGGMAVTSWKKKKWISWICVLLILITGFSRNYLGVHTPQDVAVGILLGCASLYGVYRLFHYLEEHPEKEDLWLLGGLLVTIAAVFYITFKPYPMDYIDGKLLVDPQKMMHDGYKDLGMFGGFCISRYLEKHFVGFRAAGLNRKGILTSLIGIVPLYLISKRLPGPMESVFGANFGGMLSRVALVFFIVLIWPLVIRFVTGKSGEKEKTA